MINKPRKLYFKDEDFLVAIGNKIRDCRISKGISIENLAFKSEVPYSQVSRMELGKVNFSISFLSKIAKALLVNPKDLLP
ncbi:MAG: helix-turn-helix transcriptional regulator [Ferruginibacter sp.]|nr:helix-turn-helix transcriptional regulator [Ferruginibacter sp.]